MLRNTLLPFLLACAFCLSAPVAAQQYGRAAGGGADPRPLNLSQPRATAPVPDVAVEQDTTSRTEMDEGDTSVDTGNDVTDCPYGTGFEARQRRFGRRWQGGNAGMGGFGGGRGRGR